MSFFKDLLEDSIIEVAIDTHSPYLAYFKNYDEETRSVIFYSRGRSSYTAHKKLASHLTAMSEDRCRIVLRKKEEEKSDLEKMLGELEDHIATCQTNSGRGVFNCPTCMFLNGPYCELKTTIRALNKIILSKKETENE